jgi:hypothetical protein
LPPAAGDRNESLDCVKSLLLLKDPAIVGDDAFFDAIDARLGRRLLKKSVL